MIKNLHIPLLGFAAYSGTGKTTLLEQLIPLLSQIDIKIGVIKHAHHNFDIDFPGKDSFRLRNAGATETLVASDQRWALVHEHKTAQTDPELQALITHLDTNKLDLILVEGFKHENFPRIELHRKELDKPCLYPDDSNIIAVASNVILPVPQEITLLDINNPRAICHFILQNFLSKHPGSNYFRANI